MDDAFVARWTSSLPVIPASRLVTQESEREQTTLDTFGRILKESLKQLDLFGASLKMSADTLPLDSLLFIEAYEIWVTQLRQDCLRRQSATHRTNENGCLYWPTSTIGDAKQSKTYKRGNPQLHSLVENWPTPNVPNRGKEIDKSHRPKAGGIDLQSTVGLLDQDSPNTNGKSQGLWPSPTSADTEGIGPRPSRIATNRKTEYLSRTVNTKKGKLNPDWVEQLMGLPVGWTDCDY